MVNSAPAITTQPANQAVSVGETASFNAAASGYPPPSPQWQIERGQWRDLERHPRRHRANVELYGAGRRQR